MENLTHSLFGAVLYRSGFDRYVPNALPLWVIGANLPDIDVIVNLFGKTAYLRYHRGLTHAIPGVIILSLLLATTWFFWQRWRVSATSNNTATNLSPFSLWLRLFISSLVAVGTHPMLDGLNNYGIRPFLPWNEKWFYGDLVFIVDPWIWLILGGAVFLTGVRSKNLTAIWAVLAVIAWQVMFFSGRVANIAIAIWTVGVGLLTSIRVYFRDWTTDKGKNWVARIALIFLCSYLLTLNYFQTQALTKAENYFQTQVKEKVTKFSVSPTPANPLKWEFLGESQNNFYFGIINLTNNNLTTPKQIFVDRDSLIFQKALATPEGKELLAFSRYLIALQEDTSEGTLVTLCDGRYVRDFYSRHPEFACIKVLVK